MCIVALLFVTSLSAQKRGQHRQEIAIEEFVPIADSINTYLSPKATVLGKVSLENIFVVGNQVLELYFSRSLSEYPIRDYDVKNLYSIIRALLPKGYEKYQIKGYSSKTTFEELSSPFYSERKIDKKRGKGKTDKGRWVTPLDREYPLSNALDDSHIALWQSHGFYYDQKLARWEWQRARIFQTVEDIYTQSYVLPFLVPMLENAGAYVMLPRERDYHSYELIVDNDPSTSSRVGGEYLEEGDWRDSGVKAFADLKESYEHSENPFEMGSARVTDVVKGETPTATVRWTTNVDEDGEYALYVSYVTLKNSTKSAIYTVHFEGGAKRFAVDQTMGGGTWVYLGTFPFKGGENYHVELTNNLPKGSYIKGAVVSADGVKVGGGMGNIARKPSESITENRQSALPEESTQIKGELFSIYSEVSGYPRIKEGSRYWLQWAGFSDTIYSPNKNMNDYNDDYMSRGRWVNVLSGGSRVNPHEKGYNVPIDLSMAFHTDAGTTLDDSMIGTLSIYTRFSNNKDTYPTGESRMLGRELADMVQTQIVDDIRAKYESEWPRRGLWDRSYSESRTPEVPAFLLELLSHQNLADMRYGLDPKFRFTVSRAIYKAILRFQSERYGSNYVVQPLPVESFAAILVDKGEDTPSVRLSWRVVEDPLEPTAYPEGYVVRYTKVGGETNHLYISEKGVTSCELSIDPDALYTFKVIAVNRGGESFPSEELSVGTTSFWKSSTTVMVVNGFDRVSAPASFATKDSTLGGFINYLDGGVPYINDYSFIGPQHEFRREIPWMDDDAPGFGASYANYESKVVAGNSFNYPAKHGKSILKAGFNFVSASRAAIENGDISLSDYQVVDMIMGKQVKTQMGRDGASKAQFEVFTPQLQKVITNYCKGGGKILISGSYVASDIWDNMLHNEPTKGSNIPQLKLVVTSLQKISAEFNSILERVGGEYQSAKETNDTLGYNFYNYDTLSVNRIIAQIAQSDQTLSRMCDQLMETHTELALFEVRTDPTERSKTFATEVLKFRWMTHYASATGEVKLSQNPYKIGYNTLTDGNYTFETKPNQYTYAVESPDGLVPVGENAWSVFRYADNNISAGVAYKGEDYRCVTLGFPIEVLTEESQIDALIGDILRFLTE